MTTFIYGSMYVARARRASFEWAANRLSYMHCFLLSYRIPHKRIMQLSTCLRLLNLNVKFPLLRRWG